MAWTAVNILGRALIAFLFVSAGIAKIIGPKPFLDHMAEHRVPGLLLPLVIALEIGAGALVLIGWQARWAALALAVFSLMTAFVFHLDFADKVERTQFVKDLAIAGGLMAFASLYGRAAIAP
ncbi:DoxX family protein [Phenylobacterium sp.]|uniref:DoxX family protein n=1 Tax=Phenylobacterium sp. TaxID=1871053 RepID=UPI0035658792